MIRKRRRISCMFFLFMSCAATQVLAQAVDTSQIELVEEMTRGSWKSEFYRNKAYACGYEGYHTFAIVYREILPIDEAHPLWIRLHGGGGGYFLDNGTYTPESRFPRSLTEEGSTFLSSHIFEAGLVSYIASDSLGFRFLMPSLCDHDGYSGLGTEDPNNPYNPDPDGNTRTVDGSLALRAALEYTRERFHTSDQFVHGTSAGSIGAMSLVIALGEEGKKLSGAILDSGVINPFFPMVADTGCTPFDDIDVRPMLSRLGYFTEDANMPHNAIADGRVLTPIFDVWNGNDKHMCGEEVFSVEINGQAVTDTGNTIGHYLLNQAIDSQNPGGASTWRKLCVDNVDTGKACGTHSPTKYDSDALGGDQSRGGEDYNRHIYLWVKDLIEEPLPPGC